MVTSRCVLWIGICVLVSRASYANNNFFLPGDAYFPTVITEEKLTSLKANQERPPSFEYSSFGGYDAAFCGYAGYQRAAIPELDAKFIANLAAVYSRIRAYEPKEFVEVEEDGNRVLQETNGMRVLFYPKDFEFPRFRIGLRYNEDWVDEVAEFGHEQEQSRLCCLINDADAVMESWRDANSVESLEVTLPDVELKAVPATTEPIVVRGDVNAIALDSRPLVDYFRPGDHDPPSVYIVNSSGVRKLIYKDHEWIDEAADE